MPTTCWPVSLTELLNSRFSKSLSQKIKTGDDMRYLAHMHKNKHMNTQTCHPLPSQMACKETSVYKITSFKKFGQYSFLPSSLRLTLWLYQEALKEQGTVSQVAADTCVSRMYLCQ